MNFISIIRWCFYWGKVALLCLVSLRAAGQSPTDSLMAVADSLPDSQDKVNTYYQLSYRYLYTHHQDSIAERYADSVRHLSEKIGYETGMYTATYLYALVARQRGNFDDALRKLRDYISFSAKQGDSLAVARALYSVGAIHNERGEYSENLSIQFRIARIYETAESHVDLANTLSSIGNTYRKMNRLKESGEMHRQACGIFKRMGLKRRYAMGLQNLANVYVMDEQYDSAMQLYNEALTVIREVGLRYQESVILSNLGYLHAELNHDDTAMKYQLEALALAREFNSKQDIASTLDNIGYLHFKKKEYHEAIRYFNQSLDLAKELKLKGLMQELYRELTNTYVGMQDFKSAYAYSQLHTAMKDSVLNETNMRQINELQTKYETEAKEKQINLLAREKEVQEKESQRQATLKYAFIVGMMLVAMLAVLIIYAYHQRLRSQKILLRKNEEIREVQYRKQMSELEMKALRAQINPHFLFNCMNSINRMILDGENDNASQYLAKFSKLVRLILENAESSRVSLQNEMSLLESYIQLEGLRFKGRIQYKINLDPALDVSATYLPSMVLQPFVENAIWHGLMHKGEHETGLLQINVMEKDGRLFCSIEDNGVGRDRARELADQSELRTKSMGMKITEERLRLLSKQSWEKLVNIVDLKDSVNRALGTRVEITFPMS